MCIRESPEGAEGREDVPAEAGLEDAPVSALGPNLAVMDHDSGEQNRARERVQV